MQLDFNGMGDVNVRDYVSIPEGTYLCRVAEVFPGVTRSGDARWGLRLVVAEGEFVGRQAAWDGLVFSERGTQRARRVLAALGLPTEGRVDLQPEDLVGRSAFVTVRPNEYCNPESQEIVRRHEVPYDGYRPVPGGTAAADAAARDRPAAAKADATGDPAGNPTGDPAAGAAEGATEGDDAIPF